MPLDAETRGPRVRSEAFRVEEAVASGAAAEFFLATLPPTLRQRRMALAGRPGAVHRSHRGCAVQGDTAAAIRHDCCRHAGYGAYQ